VPLKIRCAHTPVKPPHDFTPSTRMPERDFRRLL